MQPLPEQPALPFDIDPREADRAARTERMRAAGLLPPQRYQVIPEDLAPPVRPRRGVLRLMIGLLRARHRA